MLLSQIKALLANKLAVEIFKFKIKDEVKEYQKQLKKKGSSAPIYLIEDIDYCLTENDVNCFLGLVNTTKLNQYEASYVADALLLGEAVSFDTDNLATLLEYLVIDNII